MNVSPSEKERQWAVACHLSAFFGLVMIPIGALIGPFCIWILKRHQYPFVNVVGREALNFQISMLIWSLLSLALIFVGIGLFVLLALAAVNVICIIVASIQATKGISFHYPLSIRIL